jgi:glycogen operon protein
LLVVNAHHEAVEFTLPEVPGGTIWRCLLDTNQPEHHELEAFETGAAYTVTGRSLLLFALVPEGEVSVALRQAARALRRVREAPAPLPEEATASAGATPPAAAG